MSGLSDFMLSMLLDNCNAIELEVERSEEYKNLMIQLDYLKKQLNYETDSLKRNQLWNQIEEIHEQRYNIRMIKCVTMAVTESYKYENPDNCFEK